MRIPIATHLGDNTVSVLTDLARGLSRSEALADLGLKPWFEPDLPADQRLRAIDHGEFDLVWVCGLYTVTRLVPTPYRVVAAPIFAGSTTPTYHSVIVARPDAELSSLDQAVAQGAQLVANEPESWSGYHGLGHELRRRDLDPSMLSQATFSGSHRNSVAAVGTTDDRPAHRRRTKRIAAIDNTIWEHLRAGGDRSTADLVVIDRTGDWPSPPFSLRADLDLDEAAALEQALLDPATLDSVPGLAGMVPAGDDAYRTMIT